MDKRAAFAHFKEITGSKSEQECEQYLEACGYDVSNAVDLFFAQAAENAQSRAGRGGGGGARNGNGKASGSAAPDVCMLSDDDDDVEVVSSKPRLRTAHQSKGGRPVASSSKAAASTSSAGMDDEEVRAPMQFSRGPVIHGSLQHQYGAGRQRVAGNSVFNQIGDFRQETANQQQAISVFLLQRHTASYDVTLPPPLAANQQQALRRAALGLTAQTNNVPVGNVPSSSGKPNLQSLFRPPTDLMFLGDWEGCKSEALREERWLLVNVQDMQVFASQTLNRDVWSNAGVKELVKANFLFWQICQDAPDGARICNYYHVTSFPSLFVVDPRTGELVHRLQLRSHVDAVTVCDQLTTFLDRLPDFAARDRSLVGDAAPLQADHAMPSTAQGGGEAGAGGEMENGASTSSQGGGGRRKRKQCGGGEGEEMDTDRQAGKRGRVQEEVAMSGMEEDLVDSLLGNGTRQLSFVDADEWKKEARSDGVEAKVLLRFPDGTRHPITISEESPLKAVWTFIAGRGLSARDHLLILSFPRREYGVAEEARSLKELGFSRNEMVHVETK